tara:strand:- start:111 stop:707 length:597 start_codon:yes stop_codon:yes gene_type:complete
MAKKKLLSEAQVRRFMGLAGMDANLASNILKEAGMYEEEPAADEELPPEEEPEMDMAPEEPAMDMGAEEEPEMDMAAEEGELNIDEEAIQKAVEAYDELGEVVGMLKDALPGGEEEMDMAPEEEPAMDMAPEEEPEMDMGAEEEPEEEEMLEGIELTLSEDELVQEVARRVAKRILKAKKAHAELNEALGRTVKNKKA